MRGTQSKRTDDLPVIFHWLQKMQVQEMLATLDSLGLPLLGATLPGQRTDESDDLPTWRQLLEIFGRKNFLFLADED